MAIEYITTRNIDKGRIRILKLKEEKDAEVEYTCPACGYTEKRKEAWTQPFVNGSGINQYFLIACSNCNFKLKVSKLRKEIKKK
jgi:predicted nucleic-acid-binding Zn-ribbon protein